MNREQELLKRIAINPKIMRGKPVVNGTRITVEQVLKLLAQDVSPAEILKDYPQFTKEDIRAVLFYAAKTAGDEEVYPITVT